MAHHILLFGLALALLACPSKPRLRAPVVPASHFGATAKHTEGGTAGATTFTGAGLHFALQSAANNRGYEPLVLRISARGVAVPVAASQAYSSAVVFSPDQQEFDNQALDLSNNDTQAINLLLAFAVGEDKYCITTPLAGVLKWVSGASVTEIKQKLLQANALPIDTDNGKGTLAPQEDGWQCTGES